MSGQPPLIVTAALDEGSLAWFEALRQAHYPAGRNRVPAHLTLFHTLPGEREGEVAEALEAACRAAAPMEAQVRGPWSLGRGVAYRLASPELEGLRASLAARLESWLGPRDRAPWRPHVTIQNHADPAEAKALLQRLQLEFEPFSAGVEGLLVWLYLAGSWRSLAHLPFGSAPGRSAVR